MDRNRLAAAIVIVASVATIAFLARRDRTLPSGSTAPKTPEDAIYAMYGSAAAGDVKSYLAGHGDPLRAELEKNLRRLGAKEFADYLRRSQAGIKGFAIAPRGAPPSAEATRRVYEVTLVFAERNEVQYFTLERPAGRWLVTAITASEYRKPSRPYNSPVVPQGTPSEASSNSVRSGKPGVRQNRE